MANKLPLDQSILRFQENEARIDDFANGGAEGGYTSTGGDPVPSIQKFLAAKDAQINQGAASVLAMATAQAQASQNSASAAAASASAAAASASASGSAATAAAEAAISASAAQAALVEGSVFSYLTPAERADCILENPTLDMSESVQRAIDSCKYLHWGQASHKYRVTQRVIFRTPGQVNHGAGALIYAGATTDRLLDVTADDVSAYGLTFDGGGNQPVVSLGYIPPNVKRPRFYSCTVRNITGRVKGTNRLNHMYGFLISPYGVQDFLFRDCVFENITKHNDGVVGGAAVVGGGFCGGMFVGLNDDLLDVAAPQPVATSGLIVDCVMDNIQTIRATGLSKAEWLGFDDADGIRFYGHPTGASTLNVTVRNLRTRRVSKRGVKVSVARGVVLDGIYVDGRNLPYPPVTVAKLESGTTARNLVGVAGDEANAFYQGVELNGGKDVDLDGLAVDFCENGFSWDCVNDNSVKSVRVRNLRLPSVTSEGYRFYYHAEIASMEDVSLEDSLIVCRANTAAGILQEPAADGSGNLRVRNVQVVNGDVSIQGYGADVDGLSVKITSGTYSGYSAGAALVRIGPGLGTFGATVRNLDVDAMGIKSDYVNASRQWLVLLFSDKLDASSIKLRVPETLSATYPHIDFLGNDSHIDGLTYDGPGFCSVATTLAAARWSVKNAKRVGDGASSRPFWYTGHASSSAGLFSDVADYRPTTASSIVIQAGSGFIVQDVASRSSNANVVSHGGLAKTSNINNF